MNSETEHKVIINDTVSSEPDSDKEMCDDNEFEINETSSEKTITLPNSNSFIEYNSSDLSLVQKIETSLSKNNIVCNNISDVYICNKSISYTCDSMQIDNYISDSMADNIIAIQRSYSRDVQDYKIISQNISDIENSIHDDESSEIMIKTINSSTSFYELNVSIPNNFSNQIHLSCSKRTSEASISNITNSFHEDTSLVGLADVEDSFTEYNDNEELLNVDIMSEKISKREHLNHRKELSATMINNIDSSASFVEQHISEYSNSSNTINPVGDEDIDHDASSSNTFYSLNEDNYLNNVSNTSEDQHSVVESNDTNESQAYYVSSENMRYEDNSNNIQVSSVIERINTSLSVDNINMSQISNEVNVSGDEDMNNVSTEYNDTKESRDVRDIKNSNPIEESSEIMIKNINSSISFLEQNESKYCKSCNQINLTNYSKSNEAQLLNTANVLHEDNSFISIADNDNSVKDYNNTEKLKEDDIISEKDNLENVNPIEDSSEFIINNFNSTLSFVEQNKSIFSANYHQINISSYYDISYKSTSKYTNALHETSSLHMIHNDTYSEREYNDSDEQKEDEIITEKDDIEISNHIEEWNEIMFKSIDSSASFVEKNVSILSTQFNQINLSSVYNSEISEENDTNALHKDTSLQNLKYDEEIDTEEAKEDNIILEEDNIEISNIIEDWNEIMFKSIDSSASLVEKNVSILSTQFNQINLSSGTNISEISEENDTNALHKDTSLQKLKYDEEIDTEEAKEDNIILEEDNIEISNIIEDWNEIMFKSIDSSASFVEKNVTILSTQFNQINLSSDTNISETSEENDSNALHKDTSLQKLKYDKEIDTEEAKEDNIILKEDNIEISNIIEDWNEIMFKSIDSSASFVEKNVSILSTQFNQINLSSDTNISETSEENDTNALHKDTSLQKLKYDEEIDTEEAKEDNIILEEDNIEISNIIEDCNEIMFKIIDSSASFVEKNVTILSTQFNQINLSSDTNISETSEENDSNALYKDTSLQKLKYDEEIDTEEAKEDNIILKEDNIEISNIIEDWNEIMFKSIDSSASFVEKNVSILSTQFNQINLSSDTNISETSEENDTNALHKDTSLQKLKYDEEIDTEEAKEDNIILEEDNIEISNIIEDCNEIMFKIIDSSASFVEKNVSILSTQFNQINLSSDTNISEISEENDANALYKDTSLQKLKYDEKIDTEEAKEDNIILEEDNIEISNIIEDWNEIMFKSIDSSASFVEKNVSILSTQFNQINLSSDTNISETSEEKDTNALHKDTSLQKLKYDEEIDTEEAKEDSIILEEDNIEISNIIEDWNEIMFKSINSSARFVEKNVSILSTQFNQINLSSGTNISEISEENDTNALHKDTSLQKLKYDEEIDTEEAKEDNIILEEDNIEISNIIEDWNEIMFKSIDSSASFVEKNVSILSTQFNQINLSSDTNISETSEENDTIALHKDTSLQKLKYDEEIDTEEAKEDNIILEEDNIEISNIIEDWNEIMFKSIDSSASFVEKNVSILSIQFNQINLSSDTNISEISEENDTNALHKDTSLQKLKYNEYIDTEEAKEDNIILEEDNIEISNIIEDWNEIMFKSIDSSASFVEKNVSILSTQFNQINLSSDTNISETSEENDTNALHKDTSLQKLNYEEEMRTEYNDTEEAKEDNIILDEDDIEISNPIEECNEIIINNIDSFSRFVKQIVSTLMINYNQINLSSDTNISETSEENDTNALNKHTSLQKLKYDEEIDTEEAKEDNIILEEDNIEISNHVEEWNEIMCKSIDSSASFVEKNVSILNTQFNQINLSSDYDISYKSAANYTNSIHETRSLPHFKYDEDSETEYYDIKETKENPIILKKDNIESSNQTFEESNEIMINNINSSTNVIENISTFRDSSNQIILTSDITKYINEAQLLNKTNSIYEDKSLTSLADDEIVREYNDTEELQDYDIISESSIDIEVSSFMINSINSSLSIGHESIKELNVENLKSYLTDNEDSKIEFNTIEKLQENELISEEISDIDISNVVVTHSVISSVSCASNIESLIDSEESSLIMIRCINSSISLETARLAESTKSSVACNDLGDIEYNDDAVSNISDLSQENFVLTNFAEDEYNFTYIDIQDEWEMEENNSNEYQNSIEFKNNQVYKIIMNKTNVHDSLSNADHSLCSGYSYSEESLNVGSLNNSAIFKLKRFVIDINNYNDNGDNCYGNIEDLDELLNRDESIICDDDTNCDVTEKMETTSHASSDLSLNDFSMDDIFEESQEIDIPIKKLLS